MIHSIAEFSLSDQIVNAHDTDHASDDLYKLLQDNLTGKLSKSYSERSMLLPVHHPDDDEALNLQEMRKIFKQQHPWSVSDPFPQPFIPEVSPREYRSTPIFKAGTIQGQHCNGSSKHHDFLTTNDSTIVSTLVRNKPFFKWLIIVLNVLIELCQATVTQEASQGKIKREIYLKLSIIASSVCLMMSIVEIYHEVKSKGAICLGEKGCCCRFYYPGLQGQVFGSFALYFGFLSSTIQLVINLAQKFTKRNVIKFDYLPLLLALCYLVAALVGSRGKTSRAIVRCKIHGYNAVEGVLVDGHDSWVFECPECQSEI